MRYAFISRELLMRVTRELMKVLGPSLKSVILQFTALSCFAEVSKIVKGGLPPEEALESFASFVSAAGWGFTEVVSVDFEKPEMVVRTYNSSIASWFRDNVENLEKVFPFYDCAWWGYGWIGAFRAAMMEKGMSTPPLVYEETECLAKGGKYCEWVITQGEDESLRLFESNMLREFFNYENVKAAVNGGQAPGSPEEAIKGFLSLLDVKEDGTVGIGGDRTLLTPSMLFSIAYWMLPLEKFGDMIYAVYRRANNEYGKYLSRQGEKYGAENVLNFFLNSASSMGWGYMKTTKVDGQEVKIVMHQPLYGEECGAYIKLKGLNPQPSCAPMGYIVEGVLNYFAEKEGEPPFTAREEKCVAKGDKFCEFILEKSKL